MSLFFKQIEDLSASLSSAQADHKALLQKMAMIDDQQQQVVQDCEMQV